MSRLRRKDQARRCGVQDVPCDSRSNQSGQPGARPDDSCLTAPCLSGHVASGGYPCSNLATFYNDIGLEFGDCGRELPVLESTRCANGI